MEGGLNCVANYYYPEELKDLVINLTLSLQTMSVQQWGSFYYNTELLKIKQFLHKKISYNGPYYLQMKLLKHIKEQ